ncbi:hypothetical protein BB558_002636 [Smittium angustum]|uniref:Cdc23 domain-containing protein n=1 Tax=Smittium angustum TaxID=133377 RepID=A0A2U1J8C2_SMIAN|nr:hypothetical protein BB558_002636 [Smittium angustum]
MFRLETERTKLRQAITDCLDRGLIQSAKWAAEQLNYIEINQKNDIEFQNWINEEKSIINPNILKTNHSYTEEPQNDIDMAKESDSFEDQELDLYLLAKTSFDLREFAKTHYLLCNSKSNKSKFLRWFSLFLEIEKKETSKLITKESVNNMVLNLSQEIEEQKEKLDGFGFYMFGLTLKKLGQDEKALKQFITSVNMYEYNWGAWLMIEKCMDFSKNCSIIYSSLPKSLPKLAFKIHINLEIQVFLENNEPEITISKYLNLLKHIFPKSPFVTGMEGIYHYNLRNYEKAEIILEQRYEVDPFCLDLVDIHSNVLYVMENKQRLSKLAKKCTELQRHRPETCCVVANYYSLRGEHEKSIIYFERALKLDPSYFSVWTLLGHEYMHLKNTSQAVSAYRKAVEANKRDYRAWYGLGLTYELLNLTHYAIYYFQRASKLRPNDDRMLLALANCYESSKQLDDAIDCYKKLLINSPENKLNALYKLGQLFSESGVQDQAVKFYLLFICHYVQPVYKNPVVSQRSRIAESNNLYLELSDNSYYSESNSSIIRSISKNQKNLSINALQTPDSQFGAVKEFKNTIDIKSHDVLLNESRELLSNSMPDFEAINSVEFGGEQIKDSDLYLESDSDDTWSSVIESARVMASDFEDLVLLRDIDDECAKAIFYVANHEIDKNRKLAILHLNFLIQQNENIANEAQSLLYSIEPS